MNPRPTRYDSYHSDDQYACLHCVTLGDPRNSSEQDVPQADQYHQQREQAEKPSALASSTLPTPSRMRVRPNPMTTETMTARYSNRVSMLLGHRPSSPAPPKMGDDRGKHKANTSAGGIMSVLRFHLPRT